ncbi:MAG: DUF6449 domain-containing protein [Eubacteriales bacterium]
MTSKNSFWVSIRENSKRRIWVIAILSLMFFFYFPVFIGLSASSYTSQLESASVDSRTWIQARMSVMFESTIGISEVGIIFVGIAAVICALQGFSYLYNKKKVDFYHSLPVSKNRRFVTIYSNGILIFLSIYVMNLCLGILAGSIFGLMSPELIVLAGKSIVYYLLLYIAIYGVTTIGALLTGNIVVAFLATGVLLVYEMAVRALGVAFASTFFETWVYQSEGFMTETWTSPIMIFMMKILHFSDSGISDNVESMQGIIILIGYGIIFTLIGFVLYQKRPMENSAKAMAFPVTKGVVKILLIVPLALATGAAFYGIGGSNIVSMYIGCILGIVIFHGLIQVIYEFDMKAILKEKKDLMIGSVMALGILLIFQFDVFGYDDYIPKESKLASVSLHLQDGVYYESYRGELNEDGYYEYIGDWNYYRDNMYYTDVETILDLVSQSVSQEQREDGEKYLDIDIQYRLNNGTSTYRRVYVPWEENLLLMDTIVTSEEYTKAYYQILSDEFMQDYPISHISYEGSVGSCQIPKEKWEEFLTIYMEELSNLSYTTICQEVPVGGIGISTIKTDATKGETSAYWNYPVYESFTETCAFLEREQLTTTNLEPSQVKSIEVEINYEDGYHTVEYYEEDEIAEILEKMIPYGIDNYMAGDYSYSYSDSNLYYYVSAELKERTEERAYVDGVFLLNDVPEIIANIDLSELN